MKKFLSYLALITFISLNNFICSENKQSEEPSFITRLLKLVLSDICPSLNAIQHTDTISRKRSDQLVDKILKAIIPANNLSELDQIIFAKFLTKLQETAYNLNKNAPRELVIENIVDAFAEEAAHNRLRQHGLALSKKTAATFEQLKKMHKLNAIDAFYHNDSNSQKICSLGIFSYEFQK